MQRRQSACSECYKLWTLANYLKFLGNKGLLASESLRQILSKQGNKYKITT